MKIRLTRDNDQAGTATLGRLKIRTSTFQTIERPFLAVAGAPCGIKGQSCVPVGEYRMARHKSEAHGQTWALVNEDLWVYHTPEDVPAAQEGIARTACLLHSANYAYELRGCIAPGLERDAAKPAVWSSRSAMAEIRKLLPWTDEHVLIIE